MGVMPEPPEMQSPRSKVLGEYWYLGIGPLKSSWDSPGFIEAMYGVNLPPCSSALTRLG